jgi:hypothetical protein
LAENVILTEWNTTFLKQPIRNRCDFVLTNHRCLMLQQTCLLAENVMAADWDKATALKVKKILNNNYNKLPKTT